MRTWCVVSQKGGSGKTTLLLHVSVVAMAAKLTVSVIDLDPQRSAEQWAELREQLLGVVEPAVVHGTPSGLDGMLTAARKTGTDLVLIDTPPAVDKSMIFAAAAADVVIVPTRSGVLDRFALKETLDYLKRIGVLWKTVVVLNAPRNNASDRVEIESIVGREFRVALLNLALEDDPQLSDALGRGQGITEDAPRRKPAKAVKALYEQLCAFEAKLSKTTSRVSA